LAITLILAMFAILVVLKI